MIDFALIHHLTQEAFGVSGNSEVESGSKARHPQQSHGVLSEGRTDMAQDAGAQVLLALIGVDQFAGKFVARHCVDGEITPDQVIGQADIGGCVDDKAAIARCRFAFGAREGIFLVRLRMKKYRKVTADRAITQIDHLLRGGTHHHMVTILDRKPEELIADRAANCVDFHSPVSGSTEAQSIKARVQFSVGQIAWNHRL